MRLSPIGLTLATLMSVVGLPLPEFKPISLQLKNGSFSLRAVAETPAERKAQADQLLEQGIQQFNISQFQAALASWQQALNLYRGTGDFVGEANVLGNLGGAYNFLGEYATAVDYFQQSLAIVTEIGDRATAGIVVGNLGNAYVHLGEYDTAIDYFIQSLTIATEFGDLATAGGVLGNLGTAYRSLGEYATAIDYFQKSLAIARVIGDRVLEGRMLGNLGTAYDALAEYATAIDYLQQSLAIAREIGNRASEGITLNNLGTAYLKLGEHARAIDYHQQSLTVARTLGNSASEAGALSNLGLAFLNMGQFNDAETALRQGIEVWETIREQLGDNDAWKISIFEQQAHTYRLLQVVLIAQNQVEEALEISERGRARAFVDLMAQRLGNDSEITKKVDFPNLEQIKQVAQQQNATLVEYSLIGNDALYIWVIQPTGEIAFRSVDLSQSETLLAETAERARNTASTTRIRGIGETETLFTEMVRGTRDSIGNTTTAAVATATTQLTINRNLRQLHQLLIEPIADLLPNDANQKVIFIPQGSLFLVPFAAIQDENGKYLIEKHTILTAPAIQVLELTQQQLVDQNGEILIVGNPTMPKISLAASQSPQQLTPLPGTEAEANAIASLLNAQTLIGDRATETIIKQKMPQSRLIHLATHGLLEETDNGLLAAIALTPSGSDDGLLTPEEILSLDLNADLVVLSACDTGRGRLTGDGVVGLSRSILTAGARSAIVSLWQVPDAQTSALMSEFYRQWQQTGNKAQALRQAMLTTMEQYPHPMNWAAFTLMGEATSN